jgi:hypothetical protein
MKKFITFLLVFFFLKANSQNQQESITNEAIIELHKAHLSKEIIISKINASRCTFNLSIDALVALKKAGIPDEIIQAMVLKDAPKDGITKSSVTTPFDNLSPGIYLLDSVADDFLQIEPAVITNRKSDGLGDIFGPLNTRKKAVLDGKASKQKITSHKPVFIFVFDTTTPGFSNYENSTNIFGLQTSTNVQSPNEFVLLILTPVKNSREFIIGKQNSFGASSGVDNKAKLSFSFKKMKPGVYRVTIDKPLPTGEYGFMIATASSSTFIFDPVFNQKVYDFSVQ